MWTIARSHTYHILAFKVNSAPLFDPKAGDRDDLPNCTLTEDRNSCP
ncbi:MAG: hypothetical protein ACRC62_03425 [Microcoleus sp.]